MTILLDTGTFHPDRHVLETRDGEVSLAPMESRLLAYLAARPLQVVPYATLLAEVWGYSDRVRSRTVYTTVNRLRSKIERDPRAPRHVLPVPAVGYRFVPLEADLPASEASDLLTIADRLASRVPATDRQELNALQARLTEFLRGACKLASRTVAEGEDIVREGDEGTDAYVIKRGRCVVRREGLGFLREIGPGEVFGELALLSGGRRTATVTAATEVELRVVSPDMLRQGLGLDTWVGGFVAALVDRFVELEGRSAALGRGGAPR